mmetsp:Transcript_23117/g.33864  ORF Transcript_23117/g.33864 Transcript_23117/m.33864 type:complete len:882 (-) Transcript_23117:419-3064(-)
MSMIRTSFLVILLVTYVQCDVVIICTSDGLLHAYSTSPLKPLWIYDTGRPIVSLNKYGNTSRAYSVVPSIDGRLVYHGLNGTYATPIKASYLAANMPFESVDGLMFYGQKENSRKLALSVETGAAVNSMSADNHEHSLTVVINFKEYVIHAYDSIYGTQEFTIIFSEVSSESIIYSPVYSFDQIEIGPVGLQCSLDGESHIVYSNGEISEALAFGSWPVYAFRVATPMSFGKETSDESDISRNPVTLTAPFYLPTSLDDEICPLRTLGIQYGPSAIQDTFSHIVEDTTLHDNHSDISSNSTIFFTHYSTGGMCALCMDSSVDDSSTVTESMTDLFNKEFCDIIVPYGLGSSESNANICDAPVRLNLLTPIAAIACGIVVSVTLIHFLVSITSVQVIVSRNNILGKGEFGVVVYEGTFRYGRIRHEQTVAVKVYPSQLLAYVEREVGILLALQERGWHKNIVRFHHYMTQEVCHLVVLELCGKSLWDYLGESKCSSVFSADDIRSILAQISDGLSYMHKKSIAHLDLNPRNVLLFEETANSDKKLYCPKICDMGISRKVDGDSLDGKLSEEELNILRQKSVITLSLYSMKDNGTPSEESYKSPFKWDIFCLGSLFHFAIVDKLSSENNISRRLEAKDIINRMLCQDRKSRLTADQVCNHPYLWSCSRRLKFIIDIAQRISVSIKCGELFHKLVDSVLTKKEKKPLCGENWPEKVDYASPDGVNCNSTCDLIRFIRNKWVHRTDSPTEALKGLRTEEIYVTYFEDRFPDVMMNIVVLAMRFLSSKEYIQYCSFESEVYKGWDLCTLSNTAVGDIDQESLSNIIGNAEIKREGSPQKPKHHPSPWKRKTQFCPHRNGFCKTAAKKGTKACNYAHNEEELRVAQK